MIGGAETVPDAIVAVCTLECGVAGTVGGGEFATLVVAPREGGVDAEGAAGGGEAVALADVVDGVGELRKRAAGDFVLPVGQSIAVVFVGECGFHMRADYGEWHE